jgi:hypothetical protein
MKTHNYLSSVSLVSVLAMSASVFAQTQAPPGTPPSSSPPNASQTPPPPPPFEALDANSDGRITSTEAQANRALASKFAMVDKQRKGYISKEEYQVYVKNERKGG